MTTIRERWLLFVAIGALLFGLGLVVWSDNAEWDSPLAPVVIPAGEELVTP